MKKTKSEKNKRCREELKQVSASALIFRCNEKEEKYIDGCK